MVSWVLGKCQAAVAGGLAEVVASAEIFRFRGLRGLPL